MRAGHMSENIFNKTQARALIDLMQGLLLRAETGIVREELLEDALNYVPTAGLVLGNALLVLLP